MSTKYVYETQVVKQLRAHEAAARGTALGNIAGNSADVIASLVRRLEELEQH